jgi:hypothetical protein
VATGKDGRGGNSFDDTMPERDAAAALNEVAARLQAHSEALKRDIHRLQRALADINTAMAMSAKSVERLRTSTDKLRATFGDGKGFGRRLPPDPPAADRAPKPPLENRRSGDERRSGAERRRAAAEVGGLLRWIEGTSLDRRKGGDRRRTTDRRRSESAGPPPRPSRPQAARADQRSRFDEANVVSLAAARAKRKSARKSKT